MAQDRRGVRVVNTAVAENLQSRFHKLMPFIRNKVCYCYVFFLGVPTYSNVEIKKSDYSPTRGIGKTKFNIENRSV